MKITTLSLAVLFSSVWAITPAVAATKVFLLAGQSNMAGHETGLPVATYTVTQPVKYWNSSNDGWVNLVPGFGCTTNDIGPEVGFGYALHNSVFPNDDIYLVKYGQDSTSLAGPWNPDGSGSAYNTFKTRVETALASLSGQSPTIAGMIWMQGESDATNLSSAAAYAANLKALIAKVRADFHASNMPFVVGRITDLSVYEGFPGVADVRMAQETVPAAVGHASWINTDNLDMNPAAPGHYSAAGQIELGMRFANALVPTPEPSAAILFGTGLLGLAGYAWRKRSALVRRHLGLLVILGGFGWMVSSASAADPLRIMCVGDSITAGSTNAPYWTVPFTFGYRGPLYTKLKAAGYDFQFVGSSGEPWNYPWGVDFGPTASIPIQGPDLRTVGQDNHRGYSGATTGQILGGVPGGLGDGKNPIPSIVDMVNADDPDIILLMLGTNDPNASTASANISTMVSRIATAKPDAQVIIAQITPRGTWPSAKIIDYNNYIKNVLMPECQRLHQNVTMVDQYSGFLNANGSVNTSLLIDDYLVHMQPAGNELLAQVWFDGIQSVVPVPEPATISLLAGLGIMLAAGACWRFRRHH